MLILHLDFLSRENFIVKYSISAEAFRNYISMV